MTPKKKDSSSKKEKKRRGKTADTSEKDNAAEPAKVKDKTDAEKLADMQDALLRMRADFDNFRKRTIQERAAITQRAYENLMLELIPVLDHIDLGLAAAAEHNADAAFIDGYRMLSDQLVSALHKFDLSLIESLEQPFDPNIHEAISHLASEDIPEGVVMTQIRKGYLLDGKLLRAAQVAISSGPAAAEAEQKDEE